MQMEAQRPVRRSRAEQQALTRGRLLASAESAIARFGYGGASVDVIAAEAGLSKGAIYSNFATKEDLFLELLRLNMERDMEALEKIVELEPKELYQAISQWLATMHSESDCPVLATELQLQARRSPEFAEHYYALQEQQIRTLARILRAYFKVSAADLPIDAADLAACIIALAHGLSLQRPMGKSRSRSQAGRVIDELLQVLLTK
ncbi:TetR/AcrR family transcriptional regulator [Paraburkholderia panacisoli]|uniref:TetR/AcrR family transcriptional regulator n=2 Tax=Paraburkholderia panacisoli TaxID=2603818 RepID=A0A5B0GXJ2_9BURK|nr:TetR/AcrR family transcriptional regulator [Paraburkholderia panacisoli]